MARRTWSLIGLGQLHASVEHDGEHREVQVALEWDGIGNLNGSCKVTVDGQEVALKQVK